MPHIGEILDAAFNHAQAFVVLLAPDEVVRLRPEYSLGDGDSDVQPGLQARPNVLFEAGMAMGRYPTRTILVELGAMRPFSDVAGRFTLRMNNGPEPRHDLAMRLQTAGCAIDVTGPDWLRAGNFEVPEPPMELTATGRPAEQELSGQRIEVLEESVQESSDPSDASIRGRTFPRSPEARRRLVADRPSGWEFLLWSSELLSNKEHLEGKWRDHLQRKATPSSVTVNANTISDFPRSVLSALRGMIDRVNAVFSAETKERAFGAPGEVGDAVEIDKLAREYITAYEEMMDWAARVRGAQVSGKYTDLVQIGARAVDKPVELMRSFIEDLADDMMRMQTDHTFNTNRTLSLDLDSNVLNEFLREYERVL